MYDFQSSEQKNLFKIADSIENLKNLKTLKFNIGQGSFRQVFLVQDNFTKIKYTLQIISIFDGYDNICQEKLKNAKNEAEFLMNCSHPNVANLTISSKQKNVKKNLEEWIVDQNNAVISSYSLISFACQILSAIQYFQNKDFVLRNLSLKNILLHRHNRIKIYDFGVVNKIQSDIISQDGLTSCTENEMLYYPPESNHQFKDQNSKNNSNKEIEQNYQSTIWAFGICLSILGGATYKDCLSIQISGYKYIEQLDEGINQILQRVLSLQPNERPNIDQVKKEFEILKQKIWNPQQASILFLEYEKIKINNIQKALQLILICVDISPENLDYQNELGNIFYELKYFDDAIISYQKCLEINPKNDISYMNLGNTYKNQGMMNEAIESYQKYLEINPKNDTCYYNLGLIYNFKGMVEEAIQSYQKCQEIDPKNDKCYINLGIAYKEKGLMNQAIESFQKCLEIYPKNFSCYQHLGVALFKKGMACEAIQTFQKSLKLKPKSYSSYLNLGIVYEKEGMIDQAMKCYEKSQEINPSQNIRNKIYQCKQKI